MRFEVLDVKSPSFDFGPFQIENWILESGVSQGIHLLQIRSPSGLSATLVPTRGMGIEQVHLNGLRFGWRSPLQRPVHPAFVPVGEPSGLGWLDGFTELLVRCGLTSNGAPEFGEHGRLQFGLHGRIANLPACYLEVAIPAANQLVIRAHVDEVRFHFNKWRLTTTYRFFADSTRIEIEDRVQNLSGESRDFQMLYHYNLGAPLLQNGGQVFVPHRRVAPRNAHAASGISAWQDISSPQPGGVEQVYFFEPLAIDGRSLAVLTAPDGNSASAIEFSIDELPCFSLWKNLVAEEDGYVIGLEPATNYPNPRSFEQVHDRTVWLEPGASRVFSVTLHFADRAANVNELVERVQSIQAQSHPRLESLPDPNWSKL